MKKLLLFTILILTGFPFSFADTIYLNEGMTIEGKIVEINPRQNIVICTPDGRTFTYPIDDIYASNCLTTTLQAKMSYTALLIPTRNGITTTNVYAKTPNPRPPRQKRNM